MEYLNFTPHPISIADEAGNIIKTMDPEGPITRVDYRVREVTEEGLKGEIPIIKIEVYAVSNLPPEKDGTIYIVSSLVASLVRRKDVVAPETHFGAVKDENGKVVAVRKLRSYT